MGVYNPNIPRILGQEFVPIRDEGTTFSPSVNVVELGHSFVTNTAQTLTRAQYFVNEFPPGGVGGQVMMASVYPAGLEDKTGPIRRVVIPCNFGAITGSGITIDGATTVAEALQSPSHFKGVSAQPNLGAGSQKALDLYFNTSAYAQLLQGKRIVALNFLYTMAWDPTNATNPPASTTIDYTFDQDLTLQTGNSPSLIANMRYVSRDGVYGSSLLNLNLPQGRLSSTTEIAKIELGEINHLWSTPSWTVTQDKMPWRYEELARFEASSGPNRYRIHIEFGATASVDFAGSYAIGYAALEVLFCEEQRLIVGGTGYGASGSFTPGTNFYVLGANSITLRNLSTLASSPSLPAGNWTVVVESPDIGDLDGPFVAGDFSRPAESNTYPTLNSLRELYELSSHPGVQVNVTQTPGEVFTKEPTLVLPQIGLMTATTVIPEIHVYGRQAVAQVFGSVTASQEIYDAGLTAAAYPQVRYYARRFGDTTVPLTLSTTSPTVSGAGRFVSLTPAQWDALDPIIDGWKEVTLTFPTAPIMGTGTNPQWVWSATGETAGNRWEVLGAIAPAVSGVPGSYVVQTPSTQQLVSATYGAPASGAGINLAWISQYAPPISATADDPTSDAVILFSQDSPAITGFTVQQLNQPLSGIGLNCGLAPDYIPTALAYNQLCWGVDQANIASDLFARSVSSQWGTASSGQLWATSGGSATDFNVTNGQGTIFLSTTGTYRYTKLGNFRAVDVNGYVEIASNTAAGSQDHWGSLFVRDDGANNHWYAQVKFNPSGTVQLLLTSVTGISTHTVLGTVTIANSYTLNTKVKVRVQAQGSTFRGKAWMNGEAEPVNWQIQAASATNLTGTYVGTRSVSGNGNPTISYSNFLVSSISQGYTELQRMDDVTEWQSIMKAYNQSVACFNDYEARTDMRSDYRVRYVNVYGFAGPWSSTVSNTIPSPGVTVTGEVENVWIFTTNSFQNGSSNLAYCLGWDDEVTEDFSFPEAAGQTFQTMYGRDYVTAFRPLERGGTNFSRNLLVQAAAIAPETLEDFRSLRNMAWATVPYICLRDQEGNRWFANVSVPGGSVKRSRRLYMAPVTIVEVTDTADPVNP